MGDVSGAVDTIRDRMSYGVFDWVVSDQDVRDSMAALAELSPEERNEAISRLDDKALERLTGNAEDMSASERQDVYNRLVEGLDGEQLSRLARTFGGNDRIGRVDFANAVASHASTEAKLAFIEATKDSIDGEYSAMQGQDGNPETLAIAKVLASLSGDQAAFDTAVKSLSESQLEDVIAVGLGDPEELTDEAVRRAAGTVARALSGLKSVATTLGVFGLAAAVEGIALGAYNYRGIRGGDNGNGDGTVDEQDIAEHERIATDWGESSSYDFNHDGLTDAADRQIIEDNLGACPQ